MSFNTILIAGATGLLGGGIASAFLDAGFGEVRLLVRSGSLVGSKKAAVDGLVARGAKLVEGDLSGKDAATALVPALRGVDAVVSAVSGGDLVSGQLALVAAAKAAGVRRFVPSDFGVDPAKVRAGESAFVDGKGVVREAIERAGLEWTVVAPGIFSETLVSAWLLGGDYAQAGATLAVLGDGTALVDTTTIGDVGRFTVAALRAGDATRNQVVRVHGSTVSVNELLALLERRRGSGAVRRDALAVADLETASRSADFMTALTAFIRLMVARGDMHNAQHDSSKLEAVGKFRATTLHQFLGL